MTTETIKVGDRVRARDVKSDDFAEFTVVTTYPDGSIESAQNYFDGDFFTFEKIEHPRPTVPGIYSFRGLGSRQLLLTVRGEFFLLDFTAYGEDVCDPLDAGEGGVHEGFFSKYAFDLNYKYTDSVSDRPVVE